MLAYLESQYGNICHIGTQTTMATKSALKDTGRALGIEFKIMNSITKDVPSEFGSVWPLERCLKESPEIQKHAEKYPLLFEVAQKLENSPRAQSAHAAGIIICPEELTDHVSLRQGKDHYPVSEITMDEVEALGLLKLDLLSLRNLTVIEDCLRRIDDDELDVYKLPLDDRNVLEFLTTGDLDGVFQSSNDGMRQVYKAILPEKMNFEVITSILSIYRPGPLQFLDLFISRTNGYDYAEYAFPELKPILEETHGIILYQESVMRIATDIAGFSRGQSSALRKAISSKNEELMEQELQKLVYGSEEHNIDGMIKRGIAKDDALELARQIRAFAAYSFI